MNRGHPSGRTRSPEDLLAEQAWLRGLALALVRDPTHAADVVQDTWLAYLQGPPDSDRPLRPWLRAVLTNLVRKSKRRPPAVALDPDAVIEPGDGRGHRALEDLEQNRRLLEAVNTLEEPLRRVIALRYYSGLSAAEIAQAENCPASTARWRLQKALQLLRKRLDQLHDGDRRAWCIALGPLITSGRLEDFEIPVGLHKSTAKAVTRLSPWASPGTTAAAVLAIALLSAFIGWKAFGTHTTDARTDTDTSVDSESGAMAGDSLLSANSTEEKPSTSSEGEDKSATEEPAPTSAAPPGHALRFVDRRGVPMRDVVVEDAAGQLLAVSNAQGLVPVGLLSEAQWVRAVGLDGSFFEGTLRLPRQPEDPSHVTLSPGSNIIGIVSKPDGSPLGGVPVVARRDKGYGMALRQTVEPAWASEVVAHAVTEPNGHFELCGVAPGLTRVWAGIGGEWVWSEVLLLRPGETCATTVVERGPDGLLPATIVARITHPSGLSTDGLRTLTRGNGLPLHVGVVLEGHLRVRSAPGGLHEVLAFDPSGKLGFARLSEPNVGPEPMHLELSPMNSIQVAILTPELDLVPQASLRAIRQSDNAPLTKLAWIGCDDELPRMPLVPETKFRLLVEAPGYAPMAIGPLESGPPGAGLLEQVLEAELVTVPPTFGVVRADGAPIGGVIIDAFRWYPSNELVQDADGVPSHTLPAPDTTTRSDENGRFQLHVPSSANYVLRFSRESWADHLVGPLVLNPFSDLSNLRIELTGTGQVSGRLVPHDERPLDELEVIAARGVPPALHTRPESTGDFRFNQVPPGNWYVFVRTKREVSTEPTFLPLGAPAGWTYPSNCEVKPGETTFVELDARQAYPIRIHGRLEIRGSDTSEWSAGAFPTFEADPFSASATPLSSVSSTGHFAYTVGSQGTYTVYVAHNSPTEELMTITRELKVGGSSESEVDFAFAVGSVEGRILLPEGSYTALVWHDESGQEGLCRFYLDAEGDFSLPCVPTGTVELVTRARGDLAADSHFPGMHVLRHFRVDAETTTQLSYP